MADFTLFEASSIYNTFEHFGQYANANAQIAVHTLRDDIVAKYSTKTRPINAQVAERFAYALYTHNAAEQHAKDEHERVHNEGTAAYFGLIMQFGDNVPAFDECKCGTMGQQYDHDAAKQNFFAPNQAALSQQKEVLLERLNMRRASRAKEEDIKQLLFESWYRQDLNITRRACTANRQQSLQMLQSWSPGMQQQTPPQQYQQAQLQDSSLFLVSPDGSLQNSTGLDNSRTVTSEDLHAVFDPLQAQDIINWAQNAWPSDYTQPMVPLQPSNTIEQQHKVGHPGYEPAQPLQVPAPIHEQQQVELPPGYDPAEPDEGPIWIDPKLFEEDPQ